MAFLTDCILIPILVAISLITFELMIIKLPLLSSSLNDEYFHNIINICNSVLEVILNNPDISSK